MFLIGGTVVRAEGKYRWGTETIVQRLQRENEDMQRQMECCVCLTPMESRQVLVPCGHVLCGDFAHRCD